MTPLAHSSAFLTRTLHVGSPAGLTPRTALIVLITVTLTCKLVWGGAIAVCNDEAYHYLYTLHPDLSYFDHPPMTMLVAKAGILLCGGWVHPFSLRLGFALLFAGSTWVTYRWTARWHGEWAGVFAAGLLNLSAYHAFAGGFALPDGPFLFFALLTMWALGEAVVGDPLRTRPWVWVGLAFAGTLLSKYHAVFLPAGVVLYVLLTPGSRHLLRRPGPYLAVGIGFLGFLPVLVWNGTHGWVSFLFQGGRAVGSGFDPGGLVSVVFGPILCLLPWVWWLLVVALASRVRQFGSTTGMDRLAVCLTVVPLLFFSAIACFRWLLLHWSLIAYVPLLPLAGRQCALWAATDLAWVLRRATAMAAILLVGAAIAWTQAEVGLVRLASPDAFTEGRGWESVAAELTARGLLDDPNGFIFTNEWYASGHLAFALRDRQVPVLCYCGDARGFAFWSDPDDWLGKNGLFVTTTGDPREVAEQSCYFQRFELVAEFPMMRGGMPLENIQVYRGTNQQLPYPFTYPPRR